MNPPQSGTEADASLESPSSGSTLPQSSGWTARQRLLYVGIPVGLVVLFIGGPLEHLLFGWVYFVVRTLPAVSIDWPTIILGGVCTVAFVVCLHVTVRWFRGNVSPSIADAPPWSWRSTLAMAATLILMFAAGTAMVGVAHQTIWLLTGKTESRNPAADRQFGLVTKTINDARDAARRTRQKTSLKVLGLAMHNVYEIHGAFPPGGTMDQTGAPLHGWPIFLADYIPYSSQGIDFAIPWNKRPNARYFQCALSEFINPAISGPRFDEQGFGLSHIAGNVHLLPIITLDVQGEKPEKWSDVIKTSGRAIRLETIMDGLSDTLLIGTAGEQFKPWGDPTNLRDPALGVYRDPSGFGGPPHWGGAMFLMCDGSVRFISTEVDADVINGLGTPSGGEPVPAVEAVRRTIRNTSAAISVE